MVEATPATPIDEQAIWAARAAELAAWAEARLVNRTTAWGAYVAPGHRKMVTRKDGSVKPDQVSYTAPAKEKRGEVLLTSQVIVRHFRAKHGGDVIGLHSTNDVDSMCRWLSVDIDHHSGDAVAPTANWHAALAWHTRVASLGFNPLLVDSNGDGGYRLWAMFDRPTPSDIVYAFAQWIVSDYAALGLARAPETFPKQAHVAPGEFGNWARIPGRHHTKNHWSRVWEGNGWVGGNDAIDLLLGCTGDSPMLIPAEAAPTPTPAPAPRPQRALPTKSAKLMTSDEIAVKCLDGLRADRVDDYDSWVKVLAILHLVESETGTPMLEEAIRWSQSSSKYAEGDCEQKWKSFKASRGKIAKLGSLIKMAQDDGACIFPGDRNDPRGPRAARTAAKAPSKPPKDHSTVGEDGIPDESAAREGARNSPPIDLNCGTDPDLTVRADDVAAEQVSAAVRVRDALDTAKATFDPQVIIAAAGDLAQLSKREWASIKAELRRWRDEAGVHLDLKDLAAAMKEEQERQAEEASNAAVLDPEDEQSITPIRDDADDYLLTPGAHRDDRGQYSEIGTSTFADEVLRRVPEDAIYSMGDVPGQIIRRPGSRKFRMLDADATRMLVDSHVKLGKWVKLPGDEGQALIFVPSNRDHGSLVLNRASASEHVRQLRMMVRYPTFLESFELTSPGWNPNGVFYDQHSDLADLEPEMDMETARMTLEDLLIDFPFRSEADRQNFIGGMVTVVVAPAIGSNRPMHLVQAPLERTGKSKLIEQVLGHIFLRQEVPAEQLAMSEEERDKRIIALLIGQDTIVHLDNLKQFVDSGVLASLLTAAIYRGRLLGQTQMVTLPNNLILFGSGNNVEGTGEIIKRMVPIFLQPQTADPQNRKEFVHPDLLEYLPTVRRKVLSAILGMVCVWRAAGRPKGDRAMGGFERWQNVVGGVMQTAGYTEWLSNFNRWVKESDPQAADLNTFVALWADSHNDLARPTKYLANVARGAGLFPKCFQSVSERAQLTSFGMTILRHQLDRPIGKWKIKRSGTDSNAFYYLSELMGDQPIVEPKRDESSETDPLPFDVDETRRAG
ncbi:MAG TPA: PriCT-2 domain-containing protein [Tepidisphaeraceae bacterium]|jgi:hypothetical protein|nr:PriCT-2 domain-containing protein [Tepidisphaeraceae bacterium]